MTGDRQNMEAWFWRKPNTWRGKVPKIQTNKSPPAPQGQGMAMEMSMPICSCMVSGKEGIHCTKLSSLLKHGVPVIPVSSSRNKLVQAVSRTWQKAAIHGTEWGLLPLGANHSRVIGRVWQLAAAAVIQEAVAPAAVANEKEGTQKDQGADGAWFPLQ